VVSKKNWDIFFWKEVESYIDLLISNILKFVPVKESVLEGVLTMEEVDNKPVQKKILHAGTKNGELRQASARYFKEISSDCKIILFLLN